MSSIEYIDLPPAGWFVLDVMRKEARKWNWVALLISVHPGDLKTSACDFPGLLYLHPKDYQLGEFKAQQRWLRIPGKHRNKDGAWDALEDMMATRH
jgi:hypothetical protein